MHVRKTVLALLAAGLAVATVSGGGPAAGGAVETPVASRPGEPAGPTATITLITGDQVRLTKGKGGYTAIATAGPGRAATRPHGAPPAPGRGPATTW